MIEQEGLTVWDPPAGHGSPIRRSMVPTSATTRSVRKEKAGSATVQAAVRGLQDSWHASVHWGTTASSWKKTTEFTAKHPEWTDTGKYTPAIEEIRDMYHCQPDAGGDLSSGAQLCTNARFGP